MPGERLMSVGRALLLALLEEIPAPPRLWLRQLQRALHRLGTRE